MAIIHGEISIIHPWYNILLFFALFRIESFANELSKIIISFGKNNNYDVNESYKEFFIKTEGSEDDVFPKSFSKQDEIYNKKEPTIQLDITYTLSVDSIIVQSNTITSSFNCLYVKHLGYKTEKNVFSILKIGGIINQRFYFGYDDDDLTKEDVIFFVHNIF